MLEVELVVFRARRGRDLCARLRRRGRFASALAARNASPARRLELADESLGWSDDGSGGDSESETDSGEYETQGQLAVFDLCRLRAV